MVLLRIHRPEVLNALNLALRRALAEAFRRLDADPSVRAIVLAGGAKAFCAGADLGEYVDATPIDLLQRRHDLLWGAIAACRKPVIAAVRGHALGGGCELALHADLILAGRSARFGQPEVKVGIMPGGGATQRLTRALGKHGAMKLLLLGEPIDADTAVRIGLAAEVLDDEAVEARALAMAQQLCAAAGRGAAPDQGVGADGDGDAAVGRAGVRTQRLPDRVRQPRQARGHARPAGQAACTLQPGLKRHRRTEVQNTSVSTSLLACAL